MALYLAKVPSFSPTPGHSSWSLKHLIITCILPKLSTKWKWDAMSWKPKSTWALHKSKTSALEMIIKKLSGQVYSCNKNSLNNKLKVGERNALKV